VYTRTFNQWIIKRECTN